MLARSRDLSVTIGATVLGWVLYDLAIVATSPEPLLVLTLLPGCAIAVAVGAAVGLLLGVHRHLLMLGVLGAAGWCGLAMVPSAHVGLARIWLPRAILLLLLGAGAAAWLVRRWHLPRVATALALGASAAVGPALIQGPARLLSWVVLAVAAGGLVATRLPQQRARRFAAAVAFMLPGLCVLAAAVRETRLPRSDQPLPTVAAPGSPNLLLVVLDTVRADHLAPYGYERTTTPGLDAFVRQSATRYTAATSTSSWTLPSHGSLFTGLYPSDHGADHSRSKGDGVFIVYEHAQPLRPDVPTLAEQLATHGYQTAAIIGNSMYLPHNLKLDRGFAHYDDRWGPRLGFFLLLQTAGFVPDVGQSVYRSAAAITDQALGWLATRAPDRPFFLFVNYMDAHVPRIPPRPYDAAFGSERPADPYAPEQRLEPLLYDRKLLYIDEHVTRLLRGLEAQHLLDNTVVIITSDHGEAFGEHCFWMHDKTLYGEVLHVPLYVKRVRQREGAISEEPTTGADVFHMALRELGLDGDRPRGNEVIAELHPNLDWSPERSGCIDDLERTLVAWMEDRVKWIVSSKGSVEAYDLGADPGELHNLAVDQAQIERAQAYAAHWWAAHPPVVTSQRRARDLDAETRERMRSLGYVGD